MFTGQSEKGFLLGFAAGSPARSHSSVSVALVKASSNSGSRVVTSSWRVSMGFCFGTNTLPVGKSERTESEIKGTAQAEEPGASRPAAGLMRSYTFFELCENAQTWRHLQLLQPFPWYCDATVRDSIEHAECACGQLETFTG